MCGVSFHLVSGRGGKRRGRRNQEVVERLRRILSDFCVFNESFHGLSTWVIVGESEEMRKTQV
jgi:hypothetical protein